MKIILLIDAWQPVIGGGQKLFKEITSRLVKDHDCQVEIITRALKDKNGQKYNQSESKLNGKLTITRLGPITQWENLLARIWFTLQSSFVAVNRDSDLYLASTFLPAFSLKLIKLFKKTPQALVVIGFGAKSKFYQFIEKLITHKLTFDLFITDDYHYYQKVKNSKKIKFIPNGVNIPKKTNMRKHKIFTFLFIGRNEPRKGMSILKTAYMKFKQNYPNTQLNLFGPKHNPVSNKRINQELNQSHCLILPSLKEGHPLVLFEAFAHKLPVIATKVGSVAKFVTKKTGYLVNPNDVKDLKKAMKLAYKNKTLNLLGQNGYQLVKKHHSWDKAARKYFQAFNSLLQ